MFALLSSFIVMKTHESGKSWERNGFYDPAKLP